MTESLVSTLRPRGFSFTRFYHHDIPADQIPDVISDGDPTQADLSAQINAGTGFLHHHSHGTMRHQLVAWDAERRG